MAKNDDGSVEVDWKSEALTLRKSVEDLKFALTETEDAFDESQRGLGEEIELKEKAEARVAELEKELGLKDADVLFMRRQRDVLTIDRDESQRREAAMRESMLEVCRQVFFKMAEAHGMALLTSDAFFERIIDETLKSKEAGK